MSNAVRYAIVGAGAISVQHSEAIEATANARLVAICDVHERSARRAGDRWSVPWYTDQAEMLARSDVDAAVICTPSGHHAQGALEALRRGKHVLIEKPIALSLDDVDQIIAEGDRRGLTVSAISQARFGPIIQQVRRALDKVALGRIVLAEGVCRYYRPQDYYDGAAWRGTRTMDGGALMNQAFHTVDLVRWLMGPVDSVAGHTTTILHRMDAEDTATASLRFSSGALGTLIATTCAFPGFSQELRIYGERGHLHVSGEEVIDWDVPGIPPAEAPGPPDTLTGTATWGTTYIGHARQYADVTQAILEGRVPYVTGWDGRATLEVVLAVYESAETGKTVAPRSRS